MSGLWLDGPNALKENSTSTVPNAWKRAAQDLIMYGLAVLPAVHKAEICDKVIEDYEDFCSKNRDYVSLNLDNLGREKRLVDFHHTGASAEKLMMNDDLIGLLDYLFGQEACAYSSLTFKYGTQQPTHRDSPHFASWPDSMFFGVWNALEDITLEAGPLCYFPGSHRYSIDKRKALALACEQAKDLSEAQVLGQALDIYNGMVIEHSNKLGTPALAFLNKGDVVIWHPQLMHGGLAASEQLRTRWSIVFHCAPVSIQIHHHQAFFLHQGPLAPPNRYGFRDVGDRKMAVSGTTAFM